MERSFYVTRRTPREVKVELQEEDDVRCRASRITWGGILKVVALSGMFAIAIIYDHEFMYVAMGAGLIVLGISIKQVLENTRR